MASLVQAEAESNWQAGKAETQNPLRTHGCLPEGSRRGQGRDSVTVPGQPGQTPEHLLPF